MTKALMTRAAMRAAATMATHSTTDRTAPPWRARSSSTAGSDGDHSVAWATGPVAGSAVGSGPGSGLATGGAPWAGVGGPVPGSAAAHPGTVQPASPERAGSD